MPKKHYIADSAFFRGLGNLVGNLDAETQPAELELRRAEFKAAAEVLKDLATYCEGKRTAIECRLAGKIELALTYERTLETVYRRIPTWARW